MAKKTVYPGVGDVFELTLDGDAAENQPMVMLKRDSPGFETCRHNGSVVHGRQTRRFKLVQIGFCEHDSWGEVLRRISTYGKIPEGQWREAFMAKFPISDRLGAIGVADTSWVDSVAKDHDRFFPYIRMNGGSCFGPTHYSFKEEWRWLVEIKSSAED